MAASRVLQRRLASLLRPNRPPSLVSPGSTWSSYVIGGIRSTQTMTNLITVEDNGNTEDHEASQNHSKPVSNPSDRTSPNTTRESNVRYSAFSNLKSSQRHDLAMIFTCKVCETRSVKTVCRESYEKGVVVARCGGCSNLHLISDRLGWFGEPGSVEDFLAARGEEVKRGSADTLNLTLEDLAGNKSS
ncbi:uncharacterized protein LOC109712293 isoform X1 [Ananas comosus]|uniref:Uncharacterized protein LOC109712293 isoform X1 n=1 Tax=Ananas comosus TaxID=4615 RepID=A0A6P5F5U8_ANACO|nr:uncharacterized protein LOC109712293 isoform X1 [Ananas comosus]